MKSHTVFLLETLLFEGAALGLGVWQFLTVWPSKKGDPSRTSPDKPPEASLSEDPRHPEG
jgi:hypothetical protein